MEKDHPVGVALSGGGHRATLFGLGALLALVDLRINRRTTQIASVSGGSIANAFVALRCRFEEMTTETFDPIVQELATTVVNRGLMTERWIWGFVAIAALAPVMAVALVLWHGHLPKPWVTVPALIVVWAALILLRGLLVERLLDARYFHSFRRVCLSDLQSKEVEHVICCTELTKPSPLYVSSWSQGRIYMRDLDIPTGHKLGIVWRAPNLPLAVAVRASAGFPGIPPRRVPLDRFERVAKKRLTFGGAVKPESVRASPSPTVFLSDGGVWNNLATQVRLEDNFFRTGEPGETPTVLFVVNASSTLGPQRPGRFYVPGWAEFKALVRIVNVQNLNTVSPRVEALRSASERNWTEDRRATGSEPLTIQVDISSSPGDQLRNWTRPFVNRPKTLFSRLEWNWARDLVDSLEEILGGEESEGEGELILKRVKDALARRPDPRTDEELRRIEDLQGWQGFSDLCSLAGGKLEDVPTTLGRIPRETAKALIARGYLNTLAGAYVFGVTDDLSLSLLSRERLDWLTGRLRNVTDRSRR